jgi:hypothetical protein
MKAMHESRQKLEKQACRWGQSIKRRWQKALDLVAADRVQSHADRAFCVFCRFTDLSCLALSLVFAQ